MGECISNIQQQGQREVAGERKYSSIASKINAKTWFYGLFGLPNAKPKLHYRRQNRSGS